jgi:hypothetical protein
MSKTRGSGSEGRPPVATARLRSGIAVGRTGCHQNLEQSLAGPECITLVSQG